MIQGVPQNVQQAIAVATNACRAQQDKSYLKYALTYLEFIPKLQTEEELRFQLMYVLNNLQGWKGPAAFEAKRILRAYANKSLA